MPPLPEDTFSGFDDLLAAASTDASPWHDGNYIPDYDLFRQLLSVPVAHGYASAQQSGRMAKAVDAWIAQELRRAGFPEDAVCPRRRRPRMLPADVAPLERQLDQVMSLLSQAEATQVAKGGPQRLRPIPLRNAITRLQRMLPGGADAHVLGRFYVKQVDVLV